VSEEILITKRLQRVKSLDSVVLLNNQILVKECFDNLSTPSKAGIYKASPQFQRNQFLAGTANRVHTVIKTCDKLTLWNPENKTSGNCLRWHTELEIEPGDTVWISYPSAIDYDGAICGGEEYKIVNYSEVRLAKKPDGSTVLCNGYVLYTHPKESRSSILIDPNPKIDFSRGIVFLTGKKNSAYVIGDKRWSDLEKDIDLKIGDTFIKETPANRLILEDSLFRYYSDEDLYLILRRNIAAILN